MSHSMLEAKILRGVGRGGGGGDGETSVSTKYDQDCGCLITLPGLLN